MWHQNIAILKQSTSRISFETSLFFNTNKWHCGNYKLFNSNIDIQMFADYALTWCNRWHFRNYRKIKYPKNCPRWLTMISLVLNIKTKCMIVINIVLISIGYHSFEKFGNLLANLIQFALNCLVSTALSIIFNSINSDFWFSKLMFNSCKVLLITFKLLPNVVWYAFCLWSVISKVRVCSGQALYDLHQMVSPYRLIVTKLSVWIVLLPRLPTRFIL